MQEMMMTQSPKPRFVSLRWRFLLPLFVGILAAAMTGAYLLASRFSTSLSVPQQNILLSGSQSLNERAASLYEQSRQEAQRVAFTEGVPENVQSGDAGKLQPILEGLARVGDLDSLIVTDARGVEVIGLLRSQSTSIYAINQHTDLSAQPMVRSVLDTHTVGATALIRSPEGYLLYTAVPVSAGGQVVGAALVGKSLAHVMGDLRGSTVIDVALYTPDGTPAQTTLNVNDYAALGLSQDTFSQAVNATGQAPVSAVTLDGRAYQAAYFPFRFGSSTLGVAAVFAPDNIPAMSAMSRQLSGLVMALVAASLVIAAYVIMNVMVVGRVNQVTQVAEALASGAMTARTGMKPADEIGAMGYALDQYANYVEERQDALRVSLRRQRREVEHLQAVIENLPEGVIVQDLDGRVMLINERAKEILDTRRLLEEGNLSDLTAIVTDALGSALVPGLYSLGDPTRVEVDGRMISAQAAAVSNMAGQRVGTVIALRDITDEVRRDRAREATLSRIAQEIGQPLTETAWAEARRQPASKLARELSRHAAALQKLVVELRDLNASNTGIAREGHRQLHLDTLVWTVANEWRQVATAANLSLDVVINRRGLYVLGDERRLRWAIGNIVDNAVKYTPPGGKISLEIMGEGEGQAQLRVRDNGAGIAPEELPYVFTRFYRGHPVAPGGRAIVVPGTGQGLTIARQIIEGHGGRVYLKSKPGVGTAAYFTLPLTAAVGLELPHLQMDMDEETVRLDVGE
jgi:two-component system sensor histidine kinase ResE